MPFFKNKKSSVKDTETAVLNETTNNEVSETQDGTVENTSTTDTNEELDTTETDETPEERDMFDNGESKDSVERDINDIVDEVIDYFTIAEPIRLNMLERGNL